jgi:putative glutamine amidotransferase
MKNSPTDRSPLILVSPETERKGDEFGDTSISLSAAYQEAVIEAGGLPLSLPCVASRRVIAESLSRADGVLMTGGNDVNPKLYEAHLTPQLRRTLATGPEERDLRELLLVDEIFRQGKPVFAICRGMQMMNVALGGTLIVDIASEVPGALNHRRFDRKGEVVHEVRLTGGSLLAKIAGKQRLGVNSTHHQAVGRVAPLLHATAASDDGVVEALELRPENARALPFFLAVQFHPERLAGRQPEHRRLFSSFTQACAVNRDTKV